MDLTRIWLVPSKAFNRLATKPRSLKSAGRLNLHGTLVVRTRLDAERLAA